MTYPHVPIDSDVTAGTPGPAVPRPLIAPRVLCPDCKGAGGVWDRSFGTQLWKRCSKCDGIGTAWADGAPSYGCDVTLADRDPGEIITLGSGEQAKIAWHMPRRTKKVRPDTTFLLLLDPFTGAEDSRPVPYPSCVGVASVDVSRMKVDDVSHAGEREIDFNDPVHRQLAGRLM